MTLVERLRSLQLIVVTGKGGVGKSTLAAALALTLTGRGRRVLTLEVDPRESLYQLFDVDPSGGQIVHVGPGLFIQNLQARAVLDQVVREQLRIGFLADRVLGSPVYQHFAEGAPGLKELAVLGHVTRVLRGLSGSEAPRVDTVVLDAPASGHILSLLAAPQLVSEVIADGPFGRMAREMAELISDAERCGIVVVTRAEEMPMQEAIELTGALERQLGRRPETILVNALYPVLQADAGASDPDDPMLMVWQRRLEVNRRELERLRRAWSDSLVELPMLPLERGPRLADALGRRMEREETG
jgi:anion-transporting  ArsA/GET3 family ATPase